MAQQQDTDKNYLIGHTLRFVEVISKLPVFRKKSDFNEREVEQIKATAEAVAQAEKLAHEIETALSKG